MSTTTALPQLFSYGHALEMADDKVGLLRDSRDAMDDVAELHRRWMARRGVVPAAAGAAPSRFLPPAREMPENAVFISYAREDLPAVQKLKAALDAAVLTSADEDRVVAGATAAFQTVQRYVDDAFGS